MTHPERQLVEEYVVYRMRLRELHHFYLILQDIRTGVAVLPSLAGQDLYAVRDTLRSAEIGWLASLFDPHAAAVNVFRLWRALFPHRESDIAAAEVALKPHQAVIMAFRSAAAFHGNKSLRVQLKVREAVFAPGLINALDEFFRVADALLQEEAAVPELRGPLSELGL
jgi:hypothetical protein